MEVKQIVLAEVIKKSYLQFWCPWTSEETKDGEGKSEKLSGSIGLE